MIEVWKDIVGYEGYYQISNIGNVKSLSREKWCGMSFSKSDEIIKIPELTNKGYKVVGLHKDGINVMSTIHRLVATHFVPNPENMPIVNHDDGDKLNCCDWNLKWSTYSINNKHAYDTGLRTASYRTKEGVDHMCNKPICQYNKNGDFIAEYFSAMDAQNKTGIGRKAISRVCTGERQYTHGFHWKFKDISRNRNGSKPLNAYLIALR